MTPPPCNCAHVETIVVWTRGAKEPEKQRNDRCKHPSGPHPVHGTMGSADFRLVGNVHRLAKSQKQQFGRYSPQH